MKIDAITISRAASQHQIMELGHPIIGSSSVGEVGGRGGSLEMRRGRAQPCRLTACQINASAAKTKSQTKALLLPLQSLTLARRILEAIFSHFVSRF